MEKENEKRRSYDLKQRIEIGKEVTDGKFTVSEASSRYGVTTKTIGNYVRAYRNSLVEVAVENLVKNSEDTSEASSTSAEGNEKSSVKSTKRYSREERADIGRVVFSGEISKAVASEKYGVAEKTISSYVKLYKESLNEQNEGMKPEVLPELPELETTLNEADSESEKTAPAELPEQEKDNKETETKPEKTKGKKKTGRKIMTVFLCLLLAAGCLFAWYYTRPKFKDLTVELGTETISISQFLTEYARPGDVRFVSDPSEIDISKTGDTSITMSQWGREETVILHVVDTTPPKAEFVENLESGLMVKPSPDELVTEVEDLSKTTVTTEPSLDEITEYGDYDIDVVVTDASGNETRGKTKISFRLIRSSITVEYGTEIKKEDLLLETESAGLLISDSTLKKLNKSDLGEYDVEAKMGEETQSCHVTIQDTTPPVLVLKELTKCIGEKIKVNYFVEKAEDNYGDVKLEILTELTLDVIGSQDVTIRATDKNGNETTATTVLYIKNDDVPPAFSGLSSMKVEKHSTPDYTSGVTAYDNIDGYVEFTVDASGVNIDAAGTYYVIYTATDNERNTVTSKRKVEVNHDEEDTNALIDKLLAKITDKSPEGIAKYLQNYVRYSSAGGDDDPVWYALTSRKGNCIVHAEVLQAFLERAGYTSQIIYTTTYRHYWNIVLIDGTWWHLDCSDMKYDPPVKLNDEDKYAYLKRRGWGDWDRNAWPACTG